MNHSDPQPTSNEINELICHIDHIASRMDNDVYRLALETSLTEIPELIAHYDARQRLVRRMCEVSHELNSILSDGDQNDPIPADIQPTEYGN